MHKIKTGLANVSYLTLGSITAQVISLLGFVFIARELKPENYGIYSMVGAFAGMFTILTFSGLNKVVLRESSRRLDDIVEIMEQSIGLRNLFCLLAWIVCIIAATFVNYDVTVKAYIAILSSEVLFLNGVNQSLHTVYQAHEKMHYMAILNVVQTLLTVILSVTVLTFGYGVFALILMQVIGVLITTIINYFWSRRITPFNFVSKISFDRDLLKQGFTFSALSFFQSLTTKIDLVMLSFLATPMEVGLYAVSFKVVKNFNLMSNMISVSFFPYFVKRYDRGAVKNSLLLKKSIFLSIPPLILAVLTIILADKAVLILVGPEYRQSATILKILVFYLLFKFMASPYGISLQATNNERIGLYTTILQSVLNIGLNYIFFYYFGLIGIAYSSVISSLVKLILTVVFGVKVMASKGYLI